MGLFAGSRDRVKGTEFVLPKSGIEGKAYGLAPSIVRRLVKTFVTSPEFTDIANKSVKDAADIIEPGTDALAIVLCECTRQEATPENMAEILDLELQDQKVLTVAAMKATFGEQGPKDFFDDWMQQLGLAGIFSNPAPANDQVESPESGTNSETKSRKAASSEEIEMLGAELPRPAETPTPSV